MTSNTSTPTPKTGRQSESISKGFSPEKMADICGIDAETLRDVARTFAGAKAGMIFWGMGVSQHITALTIRAA